MKELSKKTSDEIWIKPRYAIARFMNSKLAFKTEDFGKIIFTIKKVKERGIEPQIQLHIRFNGKDYWNKLNDNLDIDIYVSIQEFKAIQNFIKEVSQSTLEQLFERS